MPPKISGPKKKKTADSLTQLADQLRSETEKSGGNPDLAVIDTASFDVNFISTGSHLLDYRIHNVGKMGGLPQQRIIELYGPEHSGKCVTANTQVWTDRGLETITEVFARAGQRASCTSRVTDVRDLGIEVVNEYGELEPVSHLTHNGRRPVRRLTLRSGRQIEATFNHPLRVVDTSGYIVWKQVGQMEPGDTLVSAKFGTQDSAQSRVTADEAVLLGYLTGDGHLGSRHAVYFSKTYPDVQAEFIQLAEQCWGAESVVYGDREVRIHDTRLRALLAEQYGMDYVLSADKTVPEAIRHAGRDVQAAYLSAYFECDAHFSSAGDIELSSASETLARQVQVMLLGFGVWSRLSTKDVPDYGTYWRLYIPASEANTFVTQIGFRSERRAAQVAAGRRESRGTNSDNIPHLTGMVMVLRDRLGGDREFAALTDDLRRSSWASRPGLTELGCSPDRLAKIVAWGRAQPSDPVAEPILRYFEFLLDARYSYETIEQIEELGALPTFDICVPGTHSFLANGVLSHNTTLAAIFGSKFQEAGRSVVYVDAERRMNLGYSQELGLQTGRDNFLLLYPDSAEQAFDWIERAARAGAGLIILDSIPALLPKREGEDESFDDANVALAARINAKAMRRMTGILSKYDSTLLLINQVREKIGVMYGNPETTNGGRAIRFFASLRIRVSKKMGADGIIGTRENPEGYWMRLELQKNSFGIMGEPLEVPLILGEGIDNGRELASMAVKFGLVEKAGSWLSIPGTTFKAQGEDKLAEYLRTDPEFTEEIKKRIQTVLDQNAADSEERIAAHTKARPVRDTTDDEIDAGEDD
ncbi:hypothetical protein IHN63_00570 [Deinococcus sp. 6YEL10]|uniref:LAGLIDADG family homing endonuclease n=1 Tax=Deinococcus sp. 6YEL10 TaxID=2745870 RepID=UPI0021068173|nr:LAGLIDADG family homing endonuclease [Deinococcus sp. 6YEL10]MCD0159793.1 hypothetical protein [Deinococcus sp. 6YEL10]